VRSSTSATKRSTAALWIALLCAVLLASPAGAQARIRCGSWTRLAENQKLQTVDGLIEDVISSSAGREYVSFNRTLTKRCLEGYRYQIADDFDEVCSRGMREDMQVLNRTFKTYVWSCAQ
jgi:hypothetical protein